MTGIRTLVALNKKILVLLALAFGIGIAFTTIAYASIPDANGNLNTCYRNNGGDLRVIDTSTQSCANNETAFNISQVLTDNSSAFFRIKNGSVDTTTLRNINDYDYVQTNSYASGGWCIEVSFLPIYGSTSYPNAVFVNIEGYSTDIDSLLSNMCSSNHNVFLQADETQDAGNWFTK